MTELPPEVEQQIAEMSAVDFDALCARTRAPEEEADPKVRAANAMRRLRGNPDHKRATHADAAAALQRFTRGSYS